MMRLCVLAALLCSFAVFSVSAEAGSRSRWSSAEGAHPKSSYYRGGGVKVKGYVKRRGGYSYNYSDTVNTYGNARSIFGSVNSYRDPSVDQQSVMGPFDHGFFFDSPAAFHGGDLPYMN